MLSVNTEGKLILNHALKDLMDAVQYKGNHDVRYETDLKNFGKAEYWSYPKEYKGGLLGDCEDIAIYKHKLLTDAGVPSGPLLMTICTDPNGGGHCVLCVTTDKRDYILCNSHARVVTPFDMTSEGYHFLYRQRLNRGINEPWDVLK